MSFLRCFIFRLFLSPIPYYVKPKIPVYCGILWCERNANATWTTTTATTNKQRGALVREHDCVVRCGMAAETANARKILQFVNDEVADRPRLMPTRGISLCERFIFKFRFFLEAKKLNDQNPFVRDVGMFTRNVANSCRGDASNVPRGIGIRCEWNIINFADDRYTRIVSCRWIGAWRFLAENAKNRNRIQSRSVPALINESGSPHHRFVPFFCCIVHIAHDRNSNFNDTHNYLLRIRHSIHSPNVCIRRLCSQTRKFN